VTVDVIPVNENFKGLSYGLWASIWDNWLLSEDPENTNRKDIVFLRGNLNYSPVSSNSEYPRFSDSSGALVRIGHNAEVIFEDTAIFIPILTAQYSLGDIYDGKRLNNEQELREAVNRDSDESLCLWATLTANKRASKIVNDLRKFRIESPLFKLVITNKSKLSGRTQDAAKPGIYDTVVGGFFVIIRSLPRGRYWLEFGGRGRSNYNTNSIYEITAHGLRSNVIADNSSARKKHVNLA